MIVNAGKVDIATAYIKANYTNIQIGNGRDDTAASQSLLDSVVHTKTGQIPSIVGSSVVWVIDITGTDIGSTGVSELGIFHTNGTLLSRTSFPNTGVVAPNDTVTFTIQVEVN